MLFVPSLSDLDPELCNGIWTREELLAMNDRFVAAVSRAFVSGHESSVAERATVRVGGRLNGSRQLEIDAAIQAGWNYLRTNMDAGVDVSAVEILARVRAVYPPCYCGGGPRAFRRRLFSWVGSS